MSNRLAGVIVAFLCIQSVTAVPATTVDVEVVKLVNQSFSKQKLIRGRQAAYNVSPCIAGGNPNIALGHPASAANKLKYQDAPWFPNVIFIEDGAQELKCTVCMAIAGVAYGIAFSGCTAASAACLVGAFACEAVCVAVATYTLWTAEQACYCEHADCSSVSERNGGKIGAPPSIVINGEVYKLPMPAGWGYVGAARTLNIAPFAKNQGAQKCN